MEDLHNAALTLTLVHNVIRSLPMEVMSSFNDQFMEFRSKDPDNIRSPARFSFLAQYVNKLEKNYPSNPTFFYCNFSPINKGIKPVWYGSPGNHSKTPHLSSSTSPQEPSRPCTLCPFKGFESHHFALNYKCGVAKLSTPDILQISSDTKACPSCAIVHEPSFQCKLTYHNRLLQGVSHGM